MASLRAEWETQHRNKSSGQSAGGSKHGSKFLLGGGSGSGTGSHHHNHDASSSNLMAGMDATNSSGDDSSMSCDSANNIDVDVVGDVDIANEDNPHFNQSLLKLNIFQQQKQSAEGNNDRVIRHFPVELLNPPVAAAATAASAAKPSSNHSFSIESLLSSNCR